MIFLHRPVRARLAAALAATTIAVALTAPAAGAVSPAEAWQLDDGGAADIVAGLGLFRRGAVTIVPGSATGPRPSHGVTIHSEDLEGVDLIGSFVASGDTDADGYGDLITTGVEKRADGVHNRVVVVIRGGPDGLDASRAYVNQVAPPGIGDNVVVGDLDRDGKDDVVVQSGTAKAPRVTVMWGSRDGITPERMTHLRTPGQRNLGQLLAVGDVDRDRRPELLVGQAGRVPDNGDQRRIRGYLNVCDVRHVRRLVCDEPQRLPAGSTSIAVGDFTSTGRDDVVVGQPFTDYTDDRDHEPSLWLYRGTRSGLASIPVQIVRGRAGVPGTVARMVGGWGVNLAAGDVDRDGKDDLAVAAPGEHPGGRVTLLYGHRRGLGSTVRDRTVSQATPGIPGSAEELDGFGYGVALLDVNGDGRLDLVAGVPGEDDNAGGVTVVPGGADGQLEPHSSGRFEAADVGLDGSHGDLMLGWTLGH